MEEMKKNPWAKGDELERTMDPVERTSMFLERKIAESKREVDAGQDRIRDLMRDTEDGPEKNILKDRFTDLSREAARIDFCETLLRRSDRTIHDGWRLNDAGEIAGDMKNWAGHAIHLASLVTRKIKTSGENTFYPDDVRDAARQILEVYPEINFEFTETHNSIEYTATLRSVK